MACWASVDLLSTRYLERLLGLGEELMVEMFCVLCCLGLEVGGGEGREEMRKKREDGDVRN